ncbi:MAG: AAA family ATPase, partial [Oscillospiraceae bacterium]|nr:AAA family ATPase [Oscillospiraceae bacterium]
MLSTLHIENIAVIEAVDIDFAPGFNVLTGETGAGKSIVIDAISAILGERTYRDVIRTGAQKAFVSAVFADVPELAWFAENHVPWEPELLVQRELTADGRNVCRVNGQPVSVSLLRRLGTQLINIHGQHDAQLLFDEENHLRYLDLFARNDAELEAYRGAYEALLQVRREIERLSLDEGEKLRRTEMLRHQIDEIDRAALKPGEDEALEARRKLLQNAEKFSQSLQSALRSLYGDEDAEGAAGQIAGAEYALRR